MQIKVFNSLPTLIDTKQWPWFTHHYAITNDRWHPKTWNYIAPTCTYVPNFTSVVKFFQSPVYNIFG